KVGDHHAILPTETPARLADLGREERHVYDLVCRRLLSAWHGEHVSAVTTVITAIDTPEPPAIGGLGAEPPVTDRYHTSGTVVVEAGWKVPDIQRAPPKAASDDTPVLPSGLTEGQPRAVLDARPVEKKTQPPPRYTDATLLTAMETAGRTLDEKELSEA